MAVLWEFLCLVIGYFYDLLTSILSFIIPRRFKTIKDYSDDIVLITGAAGGLGRYLSLEFAKRNATLVLLDINESQLNILKEDIKREFPKIELLTFVCDCSDPVAVATLGSKLRREVGNISVVVNNAGILSGKSLLEESDREFEQVNKVNYFSHSLTAREFLPWMLENDYGYIVSICSVLAHMGAARATSYCASKSAVYGFAESLVSELRSLDKTGITVCCVCPGHISTNLFRGVTVRRPWITPSLTPEEVAKRIMDAISDKQFLVLIPRRFNFFIFLKWILPQRTILRLSKFVGLDTAMNTFVGHAKRQ